jgi:hypothetical protein
MKLPGEAQLDFAIQPLEGQAEQPLTRLLMTARYRPHGLVGLLYWYAVVPLHELVFGGMLRGIRKTAEAMHRGSESARGDLDSQEVAPGYGRARLWLGMSGVGTVVMLAALGLLCGLPAQLAPVATAPFRIQVAALAVALLWSGRVAGVFGVITAAGLIVFLLLRMRILLATAMAPLEVTPSSPVLEDQATPPALPAFMGESPDEGFTGAVVGICRPRFHLLPIRWRDVLNPEAFAMALRRRETAVQCSARVAFDIDCIYRSPCRQHREAGQGPSRPFGPFFRPVLSARPFGPPFRPALSARPAWGPCPPAVSL